MPKNFYITTTLPYVNAEPHIGFALEIVRADVLARWNRQLGKEVFFNTGVDEHGLKIYRKAKKEGIKFQFKKPMYGLTDAGKIQESRQGVPSTVVSVPCRYIHSPTSLLNLEDIQETIKLLVAFVKNSANI